VSWLDAQRFCRWLTERERASGDISPRQRYRLPTDHEWSCAVGIGHLEKEQARPETKSNRVRGFPWGLTWPPPTGAGNYAGEEAKVHRSGAYISGFSDTQAKGAGRAGTSLPNALGLQDMGGNLWEWCEDLYRSGKDWRVLRGGAWTSYRPETMASSHRAHAPESYKSDSLGFRCVLVSE
jgi:formylglycine-generating enzyme required for sulfatase activity